MIWSRRPKEWSIDEVAQRLYVQPGVAKSLLNDLVRQKLLVAAPDPPDRFCYNEGFGQDALIEFVDATYRRELVRISNLIHSKASAAVREFARAFRFTKESE